MAIRYLEDKPKIRYIEEDSEVSSPERKLPLKQFALSGLPGFGLTPGSEEALPMVGQVVGGATGGYGGAVGGSFVGDIARRGIQSLRDGAQFDFGDAVSDAGKTAFVEGVMRGGGKVLSPVLKGGANRLMNSVIKPAPKVLRRNPQFGLDALNAGLSGSRTKMLQQSNDIIAGGEDTLSGILKGSKKTVNPVKIARDIGSIKKPFINVGDDASVEAIKNVQRNFRGKGSQISLEDANQLKRDLYKVIKDTSYGKGVGDEAAKQTARKFGAGGLRRAIEVAEPSVAPINKRIGTAVTAQDSLEQALANSQRSVVIPKLAGMGAGAVTLAGNPIAGIGIIAGDRIVDLARSTPVSTSLAKLLKALSQTKQPMAGIGSSGISESVRRIQS